MYHWPFWARPNQLPPPIDELTANGVPWLTWLVLAGRGFGKTRCGTEWVRSLVTGDTPLTGGTHSRIAIVAETAADARDVMVEGESGILRIHPRDQRPSYEPSKRRLTWPNGAIAILYNGGEPDQLRGPQHDAALIDELAKYPYPRELWDMLQFGLRLGEAPKQVITTTPRPIDLLRELIKAPSTLLTRGSTTENADNLAQAFMSSILERYAGTRLGRQELEAELLDALPDALWSLDAIDKKRVAKIPDMQRVVVSIDPSGTRGASDDGDEVGIIVAGKGTDGDAYVLADESVKLSPDGWGRVAVRAFDRWKADRIIAERNFGGAMVEHVVRTVNRHVPYKEVTASRNKVARAEPVAALYEQGKVHHYGYFQKLEDQMIATGPSGYAGEGSPDRMDAMVWALTELMLGQIGRASSGAFKAA